MLVTVKDGEANGHMAIYSWGRPTTYLLGAIARGFQWCTRRSAGTKSSKSWSSLQTFLTDF